MIKKTFLITFKLFACGKRMQKEIASSTIMTQFNFYPLENKNFTYLTMKIFLADCNADPLNRAMNNSTTASFSFDKNFLIRLLSIKSS